MFTVNGTSHAVHILCVLRNDYDIQHDLSMHLEPGPLVCGDRLVSEQETGVKEWICFHAPESQSTRRRLRHSLSQLERFFSAPQADEISKGRREESLITHLENDLRGLQASWKTSEL